MNIKTIKTPIIHPNDDLFAVLEANLPQIEEGTVVAITSKIVALCEGAIVNIKTGEKAEKHAIVRNYADYYLDPHSSKYDLMLTIKNHVLAVNAGIDESNVQNHYVLWPEDPQDSANRIWQWLKQKYDLKQVGVLLTDSKTFPLKWGVMGTAIAHSGFSALKDIRGEQDLFGREMKMTKMNIAEGIAAAAVLEMGEAAEATPIALVSDVTHIQFQNRIPTSQELADLVNTLEEDAYAPILQMAEWQPGKSGK